MRQLEDNIQRLYEDYPMLSTGVILIGLFIIAGAIGILVRMKGC